MFFSVVIFILLRGNRMLHSLWGQGESKCPDVLQRRFVDGEWSDYSYVGTSFHRIPHHSESNHETF